MKVYKLKDFAKQARKSRIGDEDLSDAVGRAEKGLVDAVIGKFLIEQRVGRSGDYRTIIVRKQGERAVLVHMFPKSAQTNLTPAEEKIYREAAKILAGLGGAHIEALLAAGEWIEIDYEQHQKDISKRSAPVGSSGDGGPPQGRRDRQDDDAPL